MAPISSLSALRSGALALGLASVVLSSHADLPEALGPAHIHGTMSFNLIPPEPVNVVGSGEFWLIHGPFGRLRLDSEFLPSPYLHAAVVEMREPLFARVTANLDYEVLVLGDPGDSAPVDVVIESSGEVQVTVADGSYAMKATWAVENISTGAVMVAGGLTVPQLSDSNYYDTFADRVQFTVPANSRFRVRLTTDLGVRSGIGRAFVDPVFSFAPGTDSRYSLLFSPGVGNLPVPEPAAAVLMLAGLLALGLRRRQRR